MNEASAPLVAVVEDDPEIRELVTALLSREGFEVAPCADAKALDRLRERRRVDLAILDIMMPGEDGLSVLRRLQAEGETAVLMVTAKGDDVDRIVGLEIGADDYLAKPFNPRELVARARAILRRVAPRGGPDAGLPREAYLFENWRVDASSHDVFDPEGRPVELTGGEFDLLLCFVRHPQRVLNRDQLLDWTRGRTAATFDRTIDVQLSRLRRRLSSFPGGDKLVRTVRGGGYLFTAQVRRL